MNTLSNAAHKNSSPQFEIGDEVILSDTGEQAVVMALYRDVAWIFADRDGFDTCDLSELRRPDQWPRASV